MFCEHCGNQVSANDRFCKICGTPTNQNAYTPEQNYNTAAQTEYYQQPAQGEYYQQPVQTEYYQQPVQTEYYQQPADNTYYVAPSSTSNFSFLKIAYLSAAAAQLLLIIFRFVSFLTFGASAESFFGEISESETCSLNRFLDECQLGGEFFIFLILAIASIAFCLIPVLTNTIEKRRKLIIPMIASIYNMLIMIGLMVLVAFWQGEVNGSNSIVEASWSLTFGGWINIILAVGLFVLLIVIKRKNKQY